MSGTGPAREPDAAEGRSWASETLPLALRKELLQRELRRLELHGSRLRRPPGGDAAGGSRSEAPGTQPERPGAVGTPASD